MKLGEIWEQIKKPALKRRQILHKDTDMFHVSIDWVRYGTLVFILVMLSIFIILLIVESINLNKATKEKKDKYKKSVIGNTVLIVVFIMAFFFFNKVWRIF